MGQVARVCYGWSHRKCCSIIRIIPLGGGDWTGRHTSPIYDIFAAPVSVVKCTIGGTQIQSPITCTVGITIMHAPAPAAAAAALPCATLNCGLRTYFHLISTVNTL